MIDKNIIMSRVGLDYTKLSKDLARNIFKCGDFKNEQTVRLEFRIGSYKEEFSGGGLNEKALSSVLEKLLIELLPQMFV